MLLTQRLVVHTLVLATPPPTVAQTDATTGETVAVALLSESR